MLGYSAITDIQQLPRVRASQRDVWRTPLTTHVILISRTVSLFTRGSPTCSVEGGQKDEKVARCRRTSVVYVKTTRFVERNVEIFANYGNEFQFAGGCVCHLCCVDGTYVGSV